MSFNMRSPDIQLIRLVKISMKKSKFILFFLLIFLSMTPAYGKETIDIAAIYALTGAAAESNALALRGVGYAVDEINRQGGILGRAINLLVFDNQSTPIGSTVAAKQAARANVVAIVGSDWSSHSMAVAKVAQEVGIPMISSYSTNPEVTKIGDYIFRVCFTDDFQGEFEEEIKKALKSDADVIFIPGHDESGLIVDQTQDAGTSSIFLGGDGWSTPAFFRKGGSELKHGFYSTHWSVYLDTDQSRAFVKKYNIHSESHSVTTALAYDAMMLLAAAITRAVSTDRKKMRDAIANTRSFKGVTGTISFNDHGDPVKSAVFMEIKNGKARYLKTLEP